MFFCVSVCLSVYLIRKDEAIHIKCISAKQRVLLFLLVLCHGNRAVFPKPQLSKNNKNYCTARHETFRNHMGKYFHLLTHIVNIYIYIRDMMLKCIKQHSHAIGQRTGRVYRRRQGRVRHAETKQSRELANKKWLQTTGRAQHRHKRGYQVLSVWVREGRYICEFAQHRFIYKSSDNIIHDYISILVNICMLKRGSNCECVQGQEHMWYMKCGVLTATNFRASNSGSKNPARCTKSVFFSKIGSNWVSVTILVDN